MIAIKVKNNTELVSGFMNSFPEEAEKAIVKALLRAGKGISTDLVKDVPQEYNVKATKVRKAINGKFADRLSYQVEVSGKDQSLINFTKSKITGNKPSKGVSVDIKKSTKIIDGSFLAHGSNNNLHLFKRIQGGSYPIKVLNTVALPYMVSEDIQRSVSAGVDSRFMKNFNHEFSRFLGKE